ncbi:MAG: hypothetical protein J7M34_03240 [Anaerolineae bacterium]|nr:hypothetical protein [Anaerolineae bacterium]
MSSTYPLSWPDHREDGIAQVLTFREAEVRSWNDEGYDNLPIYVRGTPPATAQKTLDTTFPWIYILEANG